MLATSALDYVTITARLAAECRDPARRDTRRRALKAASPLADNDVSVVRSFEQNLIDALAERAETGEAYITPATPIVPHRHRQTKI